MWKIVWLFVGWLNSLTSDLSYKKQFSFSKREKRSRKVHLFSDVNNTLNESIAKAGELIYNK